MATARPIPAITPVAYSPDGQVVLNLEAGGPRDGGIIVTDDGSEVVISNSPLTNIVKMTGLKLVCTVAPTGNVVGEVKDYVTVPPTPGPPPDPGRVPITLLKVDLLTAYAIGKEIDFRFDAPLTSFTIGALTTGIIMTIPAGGGTWRAYLIGYALDPTVLA